MRDAKLIVITGPDGAGKSTLSQNILRLLNEKNGSGFAVRTSIWDSLDTGNFDQKQIHHYLEKLDGPSRTLFLFHSLLNGLSIAESKKPKVILADGYFYKYAASELAYGVDPNLVKNSAYGFPKPDLVIELQISADEAWKRKSSASIYESGGGSEGNDKEKFIKFQRKISIIWNELKNEYGPWQTIQAGPGVDELSQTVLKRIQSSLT